MIFSGSDWCKPCIQFKKEILSTDVFKVYRDENLIQLELDFPYKRSKMSKAQLAHNETLAELYNPNGAFPELILLNESGDVIKKLKYQKGMSSQVFINELSDLQ